jgi:hypothetical protein
VVIKAESKTAIRITLSLLILSSLFWLVSSNHSTDSRR